MKNYIFNNKILGVIALSLLIMVGGSCSKWTDMESLTIEKPDIESQNSGLYADYLESLRNYKKEDHKIVYVSFDNDETKQSSRAYHVASLPDSIDIVALKHPNNLSSQLQQEIAEAREKKGMKFVVDIDFDALKADYDQLIEDYEEELAKQQADSEEPKEGEEGEAENAEEGEVEQPIDFIDYMVGRLQDDFKAVNKYNYDGITISYKGRNSRHMIPEEYEVYINRENAFLKSLIGMQENSKTSLFLFNGYPQNVVDKTQLESFDYIIIPCIDATNESQLMYNVLTSLTEGVPTDNLVISGTMTSLDPTDNKTGIWSDGGLAIKAIANWANATYADFSIAGVSIELVNNDYFNAKKDYLNVREVVDILNPSIKTK